MRNGFIPGLFISEYITQYFIFGLLGCSLLSHLHTPDQSLCKGAWLYLGKDGEHVGFNQQNSKSKVPLVPLEAATFITPYPRTNTLVFKFILIF